ncbi:MAG TPA: lysylphosphatidylglycerol synthase domain-containing protein [Segeticoccus sp.]|uniref:lysylphosphatidylglycerol synthase domain-containing protein n=1 Tax=Segeticoccus sp. TaxID=2706531 RepID=UPI002D7E9091|nr:lysylphosphatidylglycerol synthase domain-containing protein [Segeticoccus sp.]HET8602069.1 lysylphosphatidylglycerol synthase domain-containing protein [Segeticoccus sp.]
MPTNETGGPERRGIRRPGRYARLRASIGRHPADIVRMAIATAIVFGCLYIARAPGINPVESAIFSELERIPSASTRLWEAFSWVGYWPGIVAAAGFALYVGRVRLGSSLLAASGTAWLLAIVLQWLTAPRPVPGQLGHVLREPTSHAFAFPSVHVAVMAALAAVAGPYLRRTTRDVAWAVVILVGVADVFLGHNLPVGALGGAAVGWGTAAFYHLVLGAPGRRTSEQAVRLALDAVGLKDAHIQPVRRRFLRPEEYGITTCDGERMQMKVVRRMHRLAGPAYKLRRLLASVEVEDEPGLSTPRHEVEHEAYVTLLAERAGIGTLPVVFAGEIRHGPPFLIRRRLQGTLLCDLPGERCDDKVLDQIWQDVLALAEQHVGHHDLRAKNILVDEDGRPRITDFTFSRVGGPPAQRQQDIADLLVTLVAVVGVPRAVDSAVRQVPRQTLLDALPQLQWLAVHRRLRQQLEDDRIVLADLRESLAERLGSPPPPFRSPVRPATLGVMLAVGLAVYLLLPQLSSIDEVLASLRRADWRWIAVAVATGFLGVLASGVTVIGSSRRKLPFWKTMAVQLAAAFTGRTTAAGIGFYGINIVYLERIGLRRTHAVGVIFLNRAVVGIITGVATAVGILVIGSAVPVGDFSLPSWPILLIAGVVLAIIVAVLVSPWGRRKVWHPMLNSLRELLAELVPTLRDPVRASQLFGGTVLFIVLQAAGLAATLAAFNPHFNLLAVLAVYVVGSTLGQLAPTPGGLGTVEAATVAGLTAVGVGPTAAVAAVLASRLLTFWLPALPGLVTFRLLQHHDVV